MSDNNYQCEECGLHYKDEATADKCQKFCKEHNACNTEITKNSVEEQL